MDSEKDNVSNEVTGSLTYMPWYEHIKEAILGHWKTLILYSVGGFGIFWGLIEAVSFFYPYLNLNNGIVLFIVLTICLVGAVLRCFIDYRHAIPQGLEDESPIIQGIARSKKHFWEYALAYELVRNRIEIIDQKLEDILKNRIHIKVVKSMDVESYIKWMQTRPENLLRIVETAKQLLIFDLVHAIHSEDGEEIDLYKLIRVVGLVGDLYKSTYDFEVEGREIIIPEGFELAHEIQFEWTSVIRDGFHQMLSILKSIAEREKDNFAPVEATITFEVPPRIDEFCEELERLITLIES